MTRATSKPLRRVVQGQVFGRGLEFVIEVSDRLLVLRPKGTRRGGPAEAVVQWSGLYTRLMWDAAQERKRAKKRRKSGR